MKISIDPERNVLEEYFPYRFRGIIVNYKYHVRFNRFGTISLGTILIILIFIIIVPLAIFEVLITVLRLRRYSIFRKISNEIH